jgi:hypothetical protein
VKVFKHYLEQQVAQRHPSKPARAQARNAVRCPCSRWASGVSVLKLWESQHSQPTVGLMRSFHAPFCSHGSDCTHTDIHPRHVQKVCNRSQPASPRWTHHLAQSSVGTVMRRPLSRPKRTAMLVHRSRCATDVSVPCVTALNSCRAVFRMLASKAAPATLPLTALSAWPH